MDRPLRVISWNCADHFSAKVDRFRELDADIAIVCEVREAHASAIGDDWVFVWHGEAGQRGLMIAVRKAWTLDVVKFADMQHMALVRVSRDKERLSIVGVWSKPPYVKAVASGLDELLPVVAGETVIVAGDFNASPRFDAYAAPGLRFVQITDRMQRFGLQSLWHSRHAQAFGEELSPTYHHQWKREQPFHIDFMFASKDLTRRLRLIAIGQFDDWCPSLSDHMPIVSDFSAQS